MPQLRPPPGQPPNLTTALKYARRGIRIFPCATSKRPLLDDWLNSSSAEEITITEWWKQNPDALIGLPTKHLDLLVIDCDKHSKDEDGVAAFDAMVVQHGGLPEHPVIGTANGGMHHVFRQPSGFKIGNRKIGQGIETRGYRLENDGGYIIAPGSVLPDGRAWKPAKGSPPFLASVTNGLCEPSAWLTDMLREKEAPVRPTPLTSPGPAGKNEEAWAMSALNRVASELAGMLAGTGRDNALMSVAGTMGRMIKAGWIGYSTVEGRLLDACRSNKLLAEVGEASARDKISRAVEAVTPHEPLPPRAAGDDAKIIQLAKLRPLDYGRLRKAAAQQLGVSLTILDGAVKEHKSENSEQAKFLPHWTVEPWEVPINGDILLKELQAHFKRYVVLPPYADVALALWVLHTWAFECFDITPYLCISSPTRRCGKTLLMTMLLWLCSRAKKNDSMSKAAIYRSVDRDKPTLVLDEVGWVVDQRDERQNILCGGFERNGHAETCEGEGANITTRLWSTYCPKAFGLIGKLTATLMDRSIEIRMQRKLGERVERLRRRDNEEHAKFRRQCLRWAQDHAKALAAATPALPEKLNDRALDFWEPLLAIAAHVGGDWTKLAGEAALALSNEENTEQEERGVELLADIKKISDSGVSEILTKDLIASLCADEERPWATYNKGKPISDRQVAKLLKPFVVISETIYAPVGSGKKDAKGYKLDKFKDAFGRYLTPEKSGRKAPSPPPEGSQASGRQNADGSSTSRVFSIRQESESDGRENGEFAYSPSDSDAQTAKKVKPHGETCSGHVGEGYSASIIDAATGEPKGEIVANGYAISNGTEDRREPEPGQLFARVTISEIRKPAISAGPHDNLDDFVAL
jgi:hypothetical protein